MVIGTVVFSCIYHVGCASNLHSIINNGLIPVGRDLIRRQIVFFLPIDPRDTDHKDPEKIDFSCTTSSAIRAQCLEETSRRVILS